MSEFSKKDLFFSIITGFITGLIAWRIFIFLNVPERFISWPWLTVIVPILWILGVNLGYFLGRWLAFFNQFGKFAAIGFTNAAVDFGILNLLIASTGVANGGWYSVFKGISFLVAMLHSYIWNKYWVFESGESGGGGVEFAKFATVSIIAIIVNVGVASFVVNAIHPLWGVSIKGWANLGAVAGSAIALLFSFIGFRLAVFKSN